jgi:hypothetical protein
VSGVELLTFFVSESIAPTRPGIRNRGKDIKKRFVSEAPIIIRYVGLFIEAYASFSTCM